jgi:hypothetical protein
MNQLTTLARLPGSGAGSSAALRAETVPKGREEKRADSQDDFLAVMTRTFTADEVAKCFAIPSTSLKED